MSDDKKSPEDEATDATAPNETAVDKDAAQQSEAAEPAPADAKTDAGEPIIDVEAEEVAASGAQNEAPKADKGGLIAPGTVLLGVLLCIVLIVFAFSLGNRGQSASGALAQNDMKALEGRLLQLETQLESSYGTATDSLSDRLSAVEAASARAAKDATQALATAAAGGDEAAAENVANRLSEIEAALSAVERSDGGKLANDLASFKTEFENYREARGGIDERMQSFEDGRAAFEEEMAARAEALESAGESLSARVAKLESVDIAAQARRVAVAVALTNLTQEALNGRPYARQLDILKQYAPDNPAVEDLSAYANRGLPSLARLKNDFRIVTRAVDRADAKENAAGPFGRLWANFLSLFTVRQIGEMEGETAEAILARAERRMAEDDLPAAVRELDNLTGAPAEAAADWLARAKTRLALDALVKELSDSLAAEIGE
ncbi:MAG: mitofilin family membrane protein [Pseudomonadota bacterium]